MAEMYTDISSMSHHIIFFLIDLQNIVTERTVFPDLVIFTQINAKVPNNFSCYYLSYTYI